MEASKFIDWVIALLTEIETTPDQLSWCQQYCVYTLNAGQESLEQALDTLFDQAYKYGMVISNYGKVIDYWNIDEQEIAAADPAWLEQQPYLCVLASIAWHFRRDHFCEGSLISDSIADGALLRLFRRLKALCPTAAPAVTLRELIGNDCQSIPTEPGVYWVLVPDGMKISFTEKFHNQYAPLYPEETLLRKYERCTEREVLYIGKAEGSGGLRQRLKQYIQYGQGEGEIHKGGRAIWQVENAGLLLLAYETCENAESREKQLLQEYKMRNNTYPLANWRG